MKKRKLSLKWFGSVSNLSKDRRAPVHDGGEAEGAWLQAEVDRPRPGFARSAEMYTHVGTVPRDLSDRRSRDRWKSSLENAADSPLLGALRKLAPPPSPAAPPPPPPGEAEARLKEEMKQVEEEELRDTSEGVYVLMCPIRLDTPQVQQEQQEPAQTSRAREDDPGDELEFWTEELGVGPDLGSGDGAMELRRLDTSHGPLPPQSREEPTTDPERLSAENLPSETEESTEFSQRAVAVSSLSRQPPSVCSESSSNERLTLTKDSPTSVPRQELNPDLMPDFITSTKQDLTPRTNQPQNQESNQGLNQEPNLGLNQEPNQGLNQEPNLGLNQEPNLGLNQEPNQRLNQEPNLGLNQEPNLGLNQEPNLGLNQEPNKGLNQGLNQEPNQGLNHDLDRPRDLDLNLDSKSDSERKEDEDLDGDSSGYTELFPQSYVDRLNAEKLAAKDADEVTPCPGPRAELTSCFCPHSYRSALVSAENRPLEVAALRRVKELLAQLHPKMAALHITRADCEVGRITAVSALQQRMMGVSSGVELLTLPHGQQLRLDLMERFETMALALAVQLLGCTGTAEERAALLHRLILVCSELKTSLGNMFGFGAVMRALQLPQVSRLEQTWAMLRQRHTEGAVLYEKTLRPFMKSLNEGRESLPLSSTSFPHVLPLLGLMERGAPGGGVGDAPQPWDSDLGVDVLMFHLSAARTMAQLGGVYRSNAIGKLCDLEDDPDVSEIFNTDFQLRLLWGNRGASEPQQLRYEKFHQVLTALSHRLEPLGTKGD